MSGTAQDPAHDHADHQDPTPPDVRIDEHAPDVGVVRRRIGTTRKMRTYDPDVGRRGVLVVGGAAHVEYAEFSCT